jgi:ferredoxin
MAYVITGPCIDVLDKSCVEVCPVDCIYHEEGVDRMLFIHPDECIDCAACEPVCPVAAIFAADDVPETQREFMGLNEAYFRDRDNVRQRVTEIAAASSK